MLKKPKNMQKTSLGQTQMVAIFAVKKHILVKEVNMGKNQNVTPHPKGGWQVKGAGNIKATARTETQTQAINLGRDIARSEKSELVIHRPNGKIRDKNSYGNDPYPPKG